jgi:hypothetical protein
MKPSRTFEGLSPELARTIRKVMTNISFGIDINNNDPDMNMAVWKAAGTTPATPNTAFTVSHNLSHVPFGFSIVRTNKAAHIFDSGAAWTLATKVALGTISLESDTATVAFTVIIY